MHSPIGYEAYLSFKSQEKVLGLDIKLILTRGLADENALIQSNDKGLLWDQDRKSQEETWRRVASALTQILDEYNGYTLCLPQSGIPYIEALVESPYCQGFTFYEEGNANYDTFQTFEQKIANIVYKYPLVFGPEALNCLKIANVDPNIVVSKHQRGVSLFDFSHEKYLGSFAFFNEAFPGYEKTILPIVGQADIQKMDQIGMILVPNLKLLKTNLMLQEYLISLGNIINLNSELNWIIKTHPNQIAGEEEEISRVLKVKSFKRAFGSSNGIYNREMSFLDFKFFIVPQNSSLHYLRLRKKKNFIVLNFPHPSDYDFVKKENNLLKIQIADLQRVTGDRNKESHKI